MAWWRRRRKPAQAEQWVPRQATWVAAAFPPEVDELVEAAFPSAAQPEVPAQQPELPAQVVPTSQDVSPQLVPSPREPAVRLGFDDGSELHLPAGDPRARALQAVADLLVKTTPAPPTTNPESSHRAARRTV